MYYLISNGVNVVTKLIDYPDQTEKVILTRQEYDELLGEIDFLNCLRACGVDNWDGYDYAVEMFNEENSD